MLLTHNHGDHTWPESINRIHQTSPEVRCVGPEESIAQVLSDTVDADHTTTIHAGESSGLGSLTVDAVYAKPPNGHPAADIAPPDVTHLGYVLKTDGVTLYFSGDPINTFADHDELVTRCCCTQSGYRFLDQSSDGRGISVL